jgi:hypothetical protein
LLLVDVAQNIAADVFFSVQRSFPQSTICFTTLLEPVPFAIGFAAAAATTLTSQKHNRQSSFALH